MPRLARLLTQYVSFRPFDRLRDSRHTIACTSSILGGRASRLTPFMLDEGSQRVAQINVAPAIDRSARRPVRVYEGPSRVILVGKIDAVCGMIDRYIADERAGKLVPFGR
jgi:hypothetical protein